MSTEVKLWLVCQNVPIWAFQNVNTETALLAYVKNRINGSKKWSKTLPNFSPASQTIPYPLVLLGRPFLRIGMSAADGGLFTLVLGQSCFETSLKPVCGKTVEFYSLFNSDGRSWVEAILMAFFSYFRWHKKVKCYCPSKVSISCCEVLENDCSWKHRSWWLSRNSETSDVFFFPSRWSVKTSLFWTSYCSAIFIRLKNQSETLLNNNPRCTFYQDILGLANIVMLVSKDTFST